MTSLVRIRPQSTRLLMQILDRPELVAAVRELPAPVLGQLIERIGLEDAGQLVSLATPEQLHGVFDEDLWRAATPGDDEQFQPERFALWLEILFEGGEAFLVEQLCALPRDLLALAVHRLVLVVDMDALGERYTGPSREFERIERALDASLHEEWEEFRVMARDSAYWDVVWSALVELDRDHHGVLRGILEQCCALSAEYIDDQGGLYEVLTAEQMLEGDVAGERDDRRAAAGYVSPADARSFLALAERGDRLDVRDPVTKAYFRALQSEAPRRPSDSGATARGPSTRAARRADDSSARRDRREEGSAGRAIVDAAADVGQLVRLLEEAAVIEPVRPASSKPALAAGSGPRRPPAGGRAGDGYDARIGGAPPGDPRPVVVDEPLPLLRSALVELERHEPDVASRRMDELGFLANVLITGGLGRRPRPIEALERAVEVCNRGLEDALGDDRSLLHAVECLRRTPADQLFRRGYAGRTAKHTQSAE